MENQKKPNDTIDMFYGFWKYLGVMGVFLVGVVMTWWGIDLLLNEWVILRTEAGVLGNIILMPLVAGLILSWLGLVEFFRIIRTEK